MLTTIHSTNSLKGGCIQFIWSGWKTFISKLWRLYFDYWKVVWRYCKIRCPMKSSVFWDIMPCRPLKVIWCFGGICRLHLQGWRVNQVRSQHEPDMDHLYLLLGPHCVCIFSACQLLSRFFCFPCVLQYLQVLYLFYIFRMCCIKNIAVVPYLLIHSHIYL